MLAVGTTPHTALVSYATLSVSMDDTKDYIPRQDAPSRDDPRQPTLKDTSHFTMTVEEALVHFTDAGLPRSERTIQRYCQRGHLTCTLVDTEISEMYLIDPSSVERRIKELQQIENISRASQLSRQDAPSRDTSRHDATVHDSSRQSVSSEKIEEYEQRIKELENQNRHLEIDKRVKEQFVNMLQEDRERLFAQMTEYTRTITDQARLIGQLESRMELGPGRPVSEPEDPPQFHSTTSSTPQEQERQSESPREAVAASESHYQPAPDPLEHPPRYDAYQPPQRATGEGDKSATFGQSGTVQ